ncbi:hypothetical protein M514_07717, partial [Trichuris suis]
DGVKLDHVDVLGIVRTQPGGVFYNRTAGLECDAKSQPTGIHPDSGVVTRDVPFSLCRILLLHSGGDLFKERSYGVVFHWFVPGPRGGIDRSLGENRGNPKPAAYREMANEL